jgi:aspartate kinase
MDMLLTTGERISMALVSMALAGLGIEAVSFTGSQVGIITDTVHTKAKILDIKGDRVREALAAGKVVVVAGFQGVSTDHEITTLGRGGSDTTAVAIAAALGADVCEIYTDVTGIFSANLLVCSLKKCSRWLALEAKYLHFVQLNLLVITMSLSMFVQVLLGNTARG